MEAPLRRKRFLTVGSAGRFRVDVGGSRVLGREGGIWNRETQAGEKAKEER
jgi:hypothetical protein